MRLLNEAFDSAKPKNLLRGMLLLVLCAGAVTAQAQAWFQVNPTGELPEGRNSVGGAATYDSNTNRMILVGGRGNGVLLKDLWVLTNANYTVEEPPSWIRLSATGDIPEVMTQHNTVYDSSSNRLSLFSYPNDVHVLTNADGVGGDPVWIRIAPTGVPPAGRSFASAVYDAGNNRMIIFGGQTSGTGDGLNDVWVLTNANGIGATPDWIHLQTIDPMPSPRFLHSAVYDSTNNEMIVFGGATAGFASNDVWVLTNANGLGGNPTWIQLDVAGERPRERLGHAAAFDSAANRMILFGGHVDPSPDPQTNDVWVLTNANGLSGAPTWIRLDVAGDNPTQKNQFAAVYDQVSNRLTIFGGQSLFGQGFLDDLWLLLDADAIP